MVSHSERCSTQPQSPRRETAEQKSSQLFDNCDPIDSVSRDTHALHQIFPILSQLEIKLEMAALLGIRNKLQEHRPR